MISLEDVSFPPRFNLINVREGAVTLLCYYCLTLNRILIYGNSFDIFTYNIYM